MKYVILVAAALFSSQAHATDFRLHTEKVSLIDGGRAFRHTGNNNLCLLVKDGNGVTSCQKLYTPHLFTCNNVWVVNKDHQLSCNGGVLHSTFDPIIK